MDITCMYVCAPHAYTDCGGQKRVPDPSELELLTVVNCLMGVGDQTKLFWKSSVLNYLATNLLPPDRLPPPHFIWPCSLCSLGWPGTLRNLPLSP